MKFTHDVYKHNVYKRETYHVKTRNFWDSIKNELTSINVQQLYTYTSLDGLNEEF